MSSDPLRREYGILLAVTGPILMERAAWYRAMSARIRQEVGVDSEAASFLEMQAQRAEETVVNLARVYDKR